MHRTLARIARAAAVVAIAGALASGPSRSQAQLSCEAQIEGSYQRDEVMDVWKNAVFGVQIMTTAPCAKVYFDLVTTERLFNGEEIATTTQMWRKVTAGGEPAFKVLFKMAKDSELIDSEIKFRRCEVCAK